MLANRTSRLDAGPQEAHGLPPEEKPDNPEPRAESAPGLPPVGILLVDDEPRNLDVLESFLQSPQYNLVRAGSADEALFHLLQGEFAVIVLDIQMPTMNGIELAGLIKMRRRTRHIPIIFLTAYFQQDSDVLVGYGSGAVDYLTKPVVPQILLSKIAVFVDLFRKTQALAAANLALQQEVGKRLKTEEALRAGNNELETRVRTRTSELSRINAELRSREASLRVSEAQAKAASRAKDDFLAALSHELRTPLHPVLLAASHHATDPSHSPEIREQFERIRRNVALEARLIDDLLDLTAVSRGILALELRAADVHESVREAVAVVRPALEEKDIELMLNLGASEPIVQGDPVRLQQVFWNLLKNAVKFTPKGGRITLETEAADSGNEVVVRVSDTGIGLVGSELDQIFAAFTQGEHAKNGGSHRFGGLGLGLAISHKLVEMHHGRIVAYSPGRDQGAVFTVSLPKWSGPAQTAPAAFAEASAPQAATGSVPFVPGPERRVRILLVEDHNDTRTTLARLLAGKGYETEAAATAAEARALIREHRFDLVISDIGLPDGDGGKLLAEIRSTQSDLPGIALSGYGMPEDVARSRRSGFAAHLTKPVGIEALHAAIRTVIGP